MPVVPQATNDSGRARLLRRTIALVALALVAATWPMWTPEHPVPQVPLFYAAGALPNVCQRLALAAMAVGLSVALLAGRQGQWGACGLLLFALSASALAAADQARIQPWAYQFTLMALVLALAPATTALEWLRLLMVSFYVYSALSKFDHAFAHTLGQQFLAALAGGLGLSIDGLSERARLIAALMFPAGELLVAIALAVPRTRRAGVVAAIALHALLLVILGPWGLNHKPGVLIWNAF